MALHRRKFIKDAFLSGVFVSSFPFMTGGKAVRPAENEIMTVDGIIPASQLGRTLSHEHILVDFIGAKDTGYHRWERSNVIKIVTPYLKSLGNAGYDSLFECTPAYLGRDPELLKELAALTGLQLITNTGYYGARENKFLPPEALADSVEELSVRWIEEWENGIDGTGVKPGFIKIGVDEGSLSTVHRKLVMAAARTHLATGLTIAAHTGTATGAFEELDVLEGEGVSAEAFIWVHAQAETNLDRHAVAARRGAWVSLDGVQDNNVNHYVQIISNLKAKGLLDKVLISQDAGWYSPGEKDGGMFRPYLSIERFLLPALRTKGFTNVDLARLLIDNPARAYGIRVRRIE